SNKSSRLNLPLGPSNSYFLSTASQGIRRRSAASASRERVKVFSFTRSCCSAASHSCCDTIGGVFIARRPFGCCLSLWLLVAILFLLVVKQTETTRSEEFSQLADAHRQNSSRGSGSGEHYCCTCDACWANMPSSKLRIRPRLKINVLLLQQRLSPPEVPQLVPSSGRGCSSSPAPRACHPRGSASEPCDGI